MTVRTLFLLLAMCAALWPVAASSAPPASAQANDSPRSVIVISLDGLAAFYLDDPKAEIPTIRALASAGAVASMMKASAPSVTWPNHTTLVTGVTPAQHGVVGNDYYDRQRKKTVVLMTEPEGAKELLVKAPTIYDVAKSSGLTTAAVRWPATGNAKTLDWAVPDVFSTELLHKYTTPALMAECKAAGVWSDGDLVRVKQRELQIVSDEVCARIFNFILRTHRPNLALLHLTNVDTIEHLKGPRTPEAYAALKAADGQVREIWEEVQRDYPDKATVLIVSDHGFTPVEQVVLPNVTLREAGLVDVVEGKASGGATAVVAQGGAALVYILDDAKRAEIVGQVKKLFDRQEGIAKVVGPAELKDHGMADPRTEPRSPDMILFAKEGYMFGDSAEGEKSLVESTTTKGTHGQDENLPAMQASFVAWGVGIKPGVRLGKIENTEVAPTIARLLGLSLPDTDGKPLAKALID